MTYATKTHVDVADSRPAGDPGECFYCRREIGEEHAWECAIPTRRVRLRATVEWETEVPRSWDADTIRFVTREKACVQNLAREIGKFADRLDAEQPNYCVEDHPVVEYLGEVE